ncbi:MAG TPA: TrmO family methyltransferase [Atribacterota bacterium]|nr:TrmO family methyltransferase [Atribacterota bacterium]
MIIGEDVLSKEICCFECGLEIKNNNLFFIDEKPVCNKCLFGDVEPLSIYPIGRVSEVNPDGVSRIDLFPYQQKFMYKLEEEERIIIIYYLHQSTSACINSVFKRGRKGNGKEVGVFASHSPHRTSRIAISEVLLVKISGTSIYVKGLDAFLDSPVLDIKSGKIDRV